MSKPLSIDRAVDKHLKPVKDSDGTLTALEVSTDTVRVKDLVVAGDINGNIDISGDLVVDGELTVNDITTTSPSGLTIDTLGGTILIKDSSPSALTPSFSITCDDSGAYGGQMVTNHDSSSPAVSDIIWFLSHNGQNDAGQSVIYCNYWVSILNKDDGTECGSILFKVMANGTSRNLITGSGTTGNLVNVDIGYGATSTTTIAGDLDIDGDTITTVGDISLVSGGDIILDTADYDIFFKYDGADASKLYISGTITKLMGVSGSHGFEIASTGTGDIVLDSSGDIDISSNDGNFIMRKGATEFSAANSAYAGMMIGCTHVFGSGTGGTFVQTSTAWENLLWDTDKFALVTFVVPPSNKVKISVHIPYVAASSYQVRLGLATDSSATTLNTKYENDIDDANRADSFNLNYSWVVEGSDHSWSAGETKTLYIMAYTGNNVRFYSGGTNTSGYGGVIVEATALPATIGDGSEP